jgi:SAM-dependent methyltransferase
MISPSSRPTGLEPELLDAGDLPLAEVERSMRDLARINRLLLASGALLRTLLPRLGGRPERVPQRVLDLGTGTGEVAADLARAAAAHGRPLRVIGIDRRLAHLRLGRERGSSQWRVVADAAALPVRDGAVDWSFSTLFFHHFEAAANGAILAEMRRVSRVGAAVVDLRRGWLLSLSIRLVLPLLGASRVTRLDGQTSARNSWSIPEVERLARGLPVLELRRRFPFRFSLVVEGEKRPSGA